MGLFTKNEADKDMDNNKMDTNRAIRDERVPDAIGLDFFVGWSRSFSTSFMSFIMYTDPEIKQNIMKAKRELCHISKLNRLYEKIIPTKMTRFLYH